MRPSPNTVGILGTSGYAGQVLHALLMQHPCIRPVTIHGRGPADAGPREVERLAECDAVALALPREASREWVAALKLATGDSMPKIIDLSDAFRLDAPNNEDARAALRSTDAGVELPKIHYGLPELYGAPTPATEIVANPGCYPTATLLVLRPLLEAGLVELSHLAVAGASGASGAGKGIADHLHFCNLSENVFPYKVGEHRHQPEIERHLGHGATISFVTTLLPIVRGLQVTAFVAPKAGVTPTMLRDALVERYRDHRWVTVLQSPDQGLGLRHVVGSHQGVLGVGPTQSSGLVPVFSSIDNLMRGAASQAVHNLNLWFGLFAGMGLPAPLEAPAGTPSASTSVTTQLLYA